MIQHRQQPLPRLPTDQIGKIFPADARSLQDAPVAQDHWPRDFPDHWIGQRLENHFGTNSRRIAMVIAIIGLLDMQLRKRRASSLSPLAIFQARDQGFFDDNGLSESKIVEKTPLSEGGGGVRISGVSSLVSVVKSGTPKILTILFPATGLLGSSSSKGISLTM